MKSVKLYFHTDSKCSDIMKNNTQRALSFIKDKLRDFKEVPSLQQALEEVTPTPRSSGGEREKLAGGGASADRDLKARQGPPWALPAAEQRHSLRRDAQMQKAHSQGLKSPASNPHQPCSPQPCPNPPLQGWSSAYERGAQQTLTFPASSPRTPRFQTWQISEENVEPQSRG